MDGGQAYSDSEILLTGKCLLELLRRNLCPGYVKDRESILLTAPWEEEDYRVGIYLYDIQDFSLATVGTAESGEDSVRYPPKAVELSYMLFCNVKHRFGGLQREQLQDVLNEIVRTVHDNPSLVREDGEAMGISFLREDVEFKMRLWQSFSQALQPAVYLRVAPVLIASARTRKVIRVKERDYGLEKM